MKQTKAKSPFHDHCGDWCMKKIIMAISMLAAIGFAFLDKDISIIGLFLSVSLGQSILVGTREIKSDKINNG